ncbi:MAG: helix-turn-helix domain-containing protein [Faecousia sp.]
MELGEKLRLARLEAGLSQRELCGEEITRNMLSRIEHGAARPSMTTLQYLAARLGKPVSFFLEETAVCSANQAVMTAARRLFDEKKYASAEQALAQYRAPDEIYDREQQLLKILIRLHLGEQAISEGREPYALELLESVATLGAEAAYYSVDLERRRLLLLGRIRGQAVNLPDLDEELLLRGEAALARGEPQQAAHLLEAAENHTSPRWCFLRGKCHMALRDYSEAARCFHTAEGEYPALRELEICYRELGDYKKAYYYACRQK